MFHKARATSATARSAGWRRRSTSSCWRASRAPTASAAPATFDCSAMDWFLERARALGVEHQPPAPLLLGRHLLELGLAAGPARRRDPEAGLRATARRSDHDASTKAIEEARRILSADRSLKARHVARRFSLTGTRDVYAANASGSTLPPETTATAPRRRPARSAAATAAAPLGSATRRASRNSHRTASRSSRHRLTVTTSSTNACTCAKVRSPGRSVSRPSAMLDERSSVTGCRRRATRTSSRRPPARRRRHATPTRMPLTAAPRRRSARRRPSARRPSSRAGTARDLEADRPCAGDDPR